jgi:tetratricopeptide (TPR) repeat protein
MMTITKLRRLKRHGDVYSYLAMVMAELAKSQKKSKAEWRRSDEAFRKRMEESDATFRKNIEKTEAEWRKSDAAFKISMEVLRKEQKEADEAFRKSMEDFKKKSEESDAAFQKRMEDINKKGEEADAKLKKDWDKKMGEVYNRLGDIAEYTFVPEAILEKFKDMGYEFDNYYRRQRIFDRDGKVRAEYDIVLCDGDTVVIVEIKIVFRQEQVDKFMRKLSEAANEKYKGKKIIGAVAGIEIASEVKNYALARGIYVIEQAGEDIKIDTLDGKFKPRIW